MAFLLTFLCGILLDRCVRFTSALKRAILFETDTFFYKSKSQYFQERFKTLTKTYHRGANAVICVFDLNNPKTLGGTNAWVNEVREYSEEPDLRVFLVGTKSDLYHAVSEEEGIRMAEKLGAEYFEVSSKTGAGIG